MSKQSKAIHASLGLALMLAMAVGIALSSEVVAQEASPGFEGFIQSGTCAAPTDDIWVELDSPRSDHDVEPYLAKVSGEDETVTLAFFGAPLIPGFGFSTMFTDQDVFSLVMTDPQSGDPVSCGDLLRPDDDNFAQIGIALIRLEPVGSSGLQGYAIIERTETSRELVIIPARVRILLWTGPVDIVPAQATPAASPVASPASSPEATS